MAALRVGVVGPGRAGRARIRTLEASERAELAGVAARADSPASFEGLLDDARVDAVFVCTPNLEHPIQVRRALEAGKHVAVEFPLAPSAREARTLFALARDVGRVLHVEHIELLSEAHALQRERAARVGRPRGGRVLFRGRAEGWVGDPELAGSEALLACARLHRLVDLFGKAHLGGASLVRPSSAQYRLRVGLVFDAGGEVALVEDRGPGETRRTRWEVVCEHGELGNPGVAPPRGLFERDTEWFLSRVEGGGPPYVSEARILHVLELIGAIEAEVG